MASSSDAGAWTEAAGEAVPAWLVPLATAQVPAAPTTTRPSAPASRPQVGTRRRPTAIGRSNHSGTSSFLAGETRVGAAGALTIGTSSSVAAGLAELTDTAAAEETGPVSEAGESTWLGRE